MARNARKFRWFAAAALLAVAQLAAPPADAQRAYRGGGFFEQLFGPRPGPMPGDQQPVVDSSRAPPPPKSDGTTTPTISIVVMGDGMADWLAYGLEEAFADAPEIGILRRHETRSGLVRYKIRSDLDWWHVAKDTLAKEKADFVIMMLGVNDRRAITDKDQKEADEPAKTDDDRQPAIMTPEQQRSAQGGPAEFRTDRWAEVYTKRIDATVAALKSKGVPVIWVGLPSIRGTRSIAEAVYLNDLYRSRVERGGGVYVDVWDGFVDEGGKFTYQGPDFEGQIRRLRAGDGVYFTKSGARKLAHYVERELRRLMLGRSVPIALPAATTPVSPQLAPNAPRPLAGPVVPLTVTPGNSDELLGGSRSAPDRSDPTASRVLVKGEPLPPAPGRADDFSWPRGGPAAGDQPMAAVTPDPAVPAKATQQQKGGKGGKSTQQPGRAQQPQQPQQPQQREAPRPPRPVAGSRDPLGWLR